MKARQLIEGATLEPESLRVAFQAFDGAWERLAPNFGSDPQVVEAVRTKLAKIILSLVNEQNRDAERISIVALEIFACT